MKSGFRKIVSLSIGLLAGIASWSLVEIFYSWQGISQSYLALSIGMGIAFGGVMGAFNGGREGILEKNNRKMLTGLIWGTLIGMGGGAVGMLAGQAVHFALVEQSRYVDPRFTVILQLLARECGWILLGLFVGIGSSMRSKSLRKILIGAGGGLLGGLVGGLCLESFQWFIKNIVLARAIGFVLMGTVLTYFLFEMEQIFSHGVIRVLNGPLKGKTFDINTRAAVIGNNSSCDVALPGLTEIEPRHATLVMTRKGIEIHPENESTRLFVNETETKAKTLKLDDVIEVGSTKLIYEVK